MSIIDKIKMANAWRELYNGLCENCRRKIVFFTRDGKQKGLSDKEISERCTSAVCDPCRAWLNTKMAEILERFNK